MKPEINYAQLRGFVFYRDGVRLPGMITVHVGDEIASFHQDWERYSTSNATVIYTRIAKLFDNGSDNPLGFHIAAAIRASI